jgi:2-polyprenyl-3-methyl-5-hydroxy-6-metoxy-1,4-benzoquinol methylase
LNPEAHQLIPYKLTPVQQPYHYYNARMRWAEPDLTNTIERMRWVYGHYELAREGAKKAAEKIQQVYSLESVGTMARERLIQLTKKTQPQKWQQIEKIERTRLLNPDIPIPGEWYDKDYFETGLKSNWDRGYTWPLFAGLFRGTAAFLSSVFSEATSYLDIGCAKGFLVRSLRECGKECWGFDHSEWAIIHAEVCVKQYLVKVSVDEINYDRQFDILLAFSLFESLTEAQINSFLSRARSWTRQAIVATITSFDSSEEERLYKRDDQDLSHITMHTRQWWHELFLKAGWKQDYLHRVVERICQNHGLPKRMGWKVYVYAPG